MALKQPEKKLAKVIEAFLGYEGHGILTCNLVFDYGSRQQATPQYNLKGEGEAYRFISGFMGACGVDSWDEIVGTTMYVYIDPHSQTIVALEPLPTGKRGKRFALPADWDDWDQV